MGGCEELVSCGMCVWDASVVEAGHIQDYACQWCLATAKCVSNGTQSCSSATDTVTGDAHRSQCPDLQCHLAPISFNVYVCEGVVITSFWVNLFLLICCLLFMLWYKSIGQQPWKFQGLENLAAMRWHHQLPSETEMDAMQASHASDDIPVRATGPLRPRRKEKTCFACTAEEECEWCATARVAFLPILISSVTCVSNILAIILFSLRRHFFEPYSLVTVSLALFTLLALTYHISKLRGPSWDPYYLRFAVILKGRSIASVFPTYKVGHRTKHLQGHVETKGSIGSLNQFPSFFGELYNRAIAGLSDQASPTADSPTPAVDVDVEKTERSQPSPLEFVPCVETLEAGEDEAEDEDVGSAADDDPAEQETPLIRVSDPVPMLVEGRYDPLVTTVRALEPKLKQKLRSVLEEGDYSEDEAVVWCCKPSVGRLLLHDVLFFQVMGTVAVGSSLFFSIAADTDLPLTKIVGSANLYIIGTIVLVSACVLVALFAVSCSRVYVLTTHNILTLYNGFWGVTPTMQNLCDVKCGMVCTYHECGFRQVVFSWRQPAGGDRRMMAPASAQFSCIERPEELVRKFTRFCPPIDDEAWSGMRAALLPEWRMYMSLFYGLLLLSITSFHYKTVPTNILILGTACCFSACIGVFMRGMRYHNATYVPVATRRRDGFRKVQWITKRVTQEANGNRPQTEDVLEAIATRRFEALQDRVASPGPASLGH